MTEPQTPTGQNILRYGQQSEASMSPEGWFVWWRQRILVIEQEAAQQERERLRALVLAALDKYRESIGPDQHYTSQQLAMQDALAYATVFVVKPLLEASQP